MDKIQDTIRSEAMKETREAFIDMRKSIKKPMTDYAKRLLYRKLQKMSSNESMWIMILEQSILNKWQDVYKVKDFKKEIQQPIKDERPEITEEMRKKNLLLLKQMKRDLLIKSVGNQ